MGAGWQGPSGSRTTVSAAHGTGRAVATEKAKKCFIKPDNPETSKDGGCWLQPGGLFKKGSGGGLWLAET
ncbi:hypothetical protein ACINB_47510 [Acidovorax sp. NB1]|nr:hypothetical protein ACINB_47510 [Acidovorax sp. NB1]